MDTNEIVGQLRQQRNQLDAAISALEGDPTAPRRGRPPKGAPALQAGRRRTMSAVARAKISAAQKTRWAKQKRSAASKKAISSPAKSTAAVKKRSRRKMSPAGRKRLSEMMKARWAARKNQQ